jgi:hypothetical protein
VACCVELHFCVRRELHSQACSLSEEARHIDVVVKFLAVHSCYVIPETKIATKTYHTTNIHELDFNLPLSGNVAVVGAALFYFKLQWKEGNIFSQFLKPLTQACTTLSVHGIHREIYTFEALNPDINLLTHDKVSGFSSLNVRFFSCTSSWYIFLRGLLSFTSCAASIFEP